MNKEKINIPIEKLMEREKVAIFQAKKKRRVGGTIKHTFLVACILGLSILGSSFVFTGMGEALTNIPLVGSIYKEFRDIAADKIERDHLATLIDKQDSQNGLTMVVKEAAYDGARLMVSVVYTGKQDFSLDGFSYITINGQPIKRANGRTVQDDIDTNTIIEHHELTFANYDEYGDKIDVAVHGENLFGYEADLEVTFPLEKIAGEISAFTPQISAKTSDEIYTVTAEKVIFTPLATRIDLTIDYPIEMDANDTWPWFEYYITDDTGRVYDGLTLQSGMLPDQYGHHMILTLPPMDVVPSYLKLTPQVTNREGLKEEVKELELVVPLSK